MWTWLHRLRGTSSSRFQGLMFAINFKAIGDSKDCRGFWDLAELCEHLAPFSECQEFRVSLALRECECCCWCRLFVSSSGWSQRCVGSRRLWLVGPCSS
jgi:hypothetical protein